MESTELAIGNNQNLYISPVVELDEAKAKFEKVRQYTANCLTKNVDYGTVPGVAKPSLLKPGAEKICSLFGLTPKFECVDKIMNWTGEGNPDNEPFFYFEYRCDLYRGGEFVASCDASCNSWEKKYRYRRGELICPTCGKPLRRSKDGNGFYCWAKQGGCGATFLSNDSRVANQKVGEVKNFDTAEQVNTFQKMAQKRAYVGATLIACNLSEYYTQDVEDMNPKSITPEPVIMEATYTQVQPQQQQTQQTQQKRKPFDEEEFLKNFNHPTNIIKMAYNDAKEIISDTENKPYDDLSIKDLYFHWSGLAKSLNNPDLDVDARDNISMKIAAICAIIWHRKQEKMLKPVEADPFVGGEA